MKNSNGKAVVSVILIIIILLLAGYIVYDKFLVKEEITTDIEVNETIIENDLQKQEVVNNNIMQENDNNVEVQTITGEYHFGYYYLTIFNENRYEFKIASQEGLDFNVGIYEIKNNKIYLHSFITYGNDGFVKLSDIETIELQIIDENNILLKKENKDIMLKKESELTDEASYEFYWNLKTLLEYN